MTRGSDLDWYLNGLIPLSPPQVARMFWVLSDSIGKRAGFTHLLVISVPEATWWKFTQSTDWSEHFQEALLLATEMERKSTRPFLYTISVPPRVEKCIEIAFAFTLISEESTFTRNSEIWGSLFGPFGKFHFDFQSCVSGISATKHLLRFLLRKEVLCETQKFLQEPSSHIPIGGTYALRMELVTAYRRHRPSFEQLEIFE